MEDFGLHYHNAKTVSIETKQAILKDRLDKNNQSYASIQGSLNSIIIAEARQRVVSNGKDVPSDDVEDVSDDDSSTASTVIDASELHVKNEMEAVDVNPTKEDMERFLTLVSEGKVHKDTLEKVHGLNEKLEETKKSTDELQIKYSKLDSEVKEIKRALHNISQYIKLENLLFHNFYLPPNYKQMSSLQFSYFMAQQINYHIPQLDFPVTLNHISTAHPLKTKRKNSNVIIVRFSNRNMRDEIFSKKHFISKRGCAITEHLTEENLNIFKKAKSVFGYKNVSTINCYVHVNVNGVRRFVKSIEHVNELLESIHADNKSVHNNNFSHDTNHTYTNSSNRAGQPRAPYSQRGRGQIFRGHNTRRHYSVRNRQY